MSKAYAYLRVSAKAQVNGDGFPRQLEAIRRYAKTNDIRLEQIFRDEGVSGTRDAVDRPAFIEMLAALHSNGTKLVLIEKLDRWARDLTVQETILAELRKNRFDLVSVEEPDQDPGRCTTSKWHSRDCWVLSHAWRYARAWTRFLCG
jgi:DNA invertase Pin-like site-specific DNA recombinase